MPFAFSSLKTMLVAPPPRAPVLTRSFVNWVMLESLPSGSFFAESSR
jgi:hypothetical protein